MNTPLPEGSLLDPVAHARLILDMESVCVTANITQAFVHQSMKSVCHDQEIDWVTNFNQYRQQGLGGLYMTGKDSGDRCMAICGALIRNFIDARLMTVNQLIPLAEKKQDMPEPTVLVIPNMFVLTHGKAMTSWQIQALYDLLLSRLTAGKPTVVYVQDMNGLLDVYGTLIHEHLIKHFHHAP